MPRIYNSIVFKSAFHDTCHRWPIEGSDYFFEEIPEDGTDEEIRKLGIVRALEIRQGGKPSITPEEKTTLEAARAERLTEDSKQ